MSYIHSMNTSGWLTKQSNGGFRKSWQKQWSILDGDKLQFYKTEEDRTSRCVIDLNLYLPAVHDPSFKKSRHAFVLQPRVASHDLKPQVIFADSLDEMNLWIKAMQNRWDERSVLDKWLDRLDLNWPSSTGQTRVRSQTMLSPTTDASYRSHGLRTYRSNISMSSSSSITTAESSLSSDGALSDDFTDRQVQDQLTRTTSLPVPRSAGFPVTIHQVISSAPTSPTHDDSFAMKSTIASRRNVKLPSLSLKMPNTPYIVCEGDPANGSPGVIFIDTPPPVNDHDRRRRSNSLPRFDTTSNLTTPTLSNYAI